MSNTRTTEQRIDQLEERDAFREEALQVLGQRIIELQEQVDYLLSRQQQLVEQVETLSAKSDSPGSQQFEIPPHY